MIAPLLLHLFQLGFTHHRIDARAEMLGHAACFANPMTDEAHRFGQVFGADEHQSDDGTEQQFGGGNVEH